MAFIPDVIVTTYYSPATVGLVAEVKAATANLDDTGFQLKHYMLRMGCPVGIILTPKVLRVYKNQFLEEAKDSIQMVGDFPSGELFKARHALTETELAVEHVLVAWLEELAQTGQPGVSDPALKSAINEHILPAIIDGHVSTLHSSGTE
jgi:hypothetical protein